MSGPYANCTQVTPECPVEATTYGYAPTLSGNALCLAIFGVCTIAQLTLGIWKRLPSFAFAVTVGCLGEAIGYVGRLMLHNNPWSRTGFSIQIICLIIAPSFLAAGIYLTLKHLVLVLGPEHSRLKPKNYTRIFISCDVVSIVAQGFGGGLAASKKSNLVNTGSDIALAGICFQAATMLLCLSLAVDFGISFLRDDGTKNNAEKRGPKTTSKSFKFYLACSSVAFVTIFIRCVYRVPELAEGWGSSLMRNQTEFMVLDGSMVAIASILLTVAHPGIFFPEFRAKNHQRERLQMNPELA